MKKSNKSGRDKLGLQFKSFKGKSKKTYLVFHEPKGGYHAFVETSAAAAARDCGAGPAEPNAQWDILWSSFEMARKTATRQQKKKQKKKKAAKAARTAKAKTVRVKPES